MLGDVGLGVIGSLVMLVTAGPSHPGEPRAAGLAGDAGALCLAQPSVRQVLLDTQDIHQGRWLLPILAPAAAIARRGPQGLVVRQGTPVLPCRTVAADRRLTGLLDVVVDSAGTHFVRDSR